MTCLFCIPTFDNKDTIINCLFCDKVFDKVTHLESHPLMHLINFRARNRYIYDRTKGSVTFLFDLNFPANSAPNQAYESLILEVNSRTNKEYYTGKKLTRQEMWILNERKDESFNEYISAKKQNCDKLSEIRKKKKESDDDEYYDERIDRIEYCISSYEEDYEDYESKCEMQEHNRNGTLQRYIEDRNDYFN